MSRIQNQVITCGLQWEISSHHDRARVLRWGQLSRSLSWSMTVDVGTWSSMSSPAWNHLMTPSLSMMNVDVVASRSPRRLKTP